MPFSTSYDIVHTLHPTPRFVRHEAGYTFEHPPFFTSDLFLNQKQIGAAVTDSAIAHL